MSKRNTTANTESESTVKRNWVKLIDDAELMLDGVEGRINRMDRELRRLLGNHQHAAEVLQLLGMEPGRQAHETLPAYVAKRIEIENKLRVYRQGQASETAKLVSDIPVNPDDRSKDVEAVTENENGKVAAAVS